MYNLLVRAAEDAWDGTATVFSADRCLKHDEYTAAKLVAEFGQLTPHQVAQLIQIPAVFACEYGCKRDAKIGRITGIQKRRGEVRVDFELLAAYPPITNDQLTGLRWELGIDDNELYRNHWALKEEDLSVALTQAGFPQIPFAQQPLVNIRTHVFDVSLSFPGEVRTYVEQVAKHLVRALGPNGVFYDNFYKSQLAVPNLDTTLQALYRSRSRLIVAFLSGDYAKKKWCGIEFRAIREIINDKNDEMVMFVRHDSAEIAGVFSHDGYIDANKHSEIEVAAMIVERVRLLT
jgi:hypothetical protein